MFKRRLKEKSGSLIIESMVAISMATMGLLGILSLLSRSLVLNQEVGQKFVATYLAAEGIEVVKSLIDKNYVDSEAWDSGLAAGSYELNYFSASLNPTAGTPILFDESLGVYGYESGNATQFKRKIEISNFDNDEDNFIDEIKVVSRVTWLSRGNSYEVALEDRFFDWR